MILSLSEGGYSQLFSHQLIGEPFTRLTSGAWDDVQPAISPDGQRVAFASNRGGAWDLYLLDLLTGSTAQLTDDDEYDGRPSWSPDGAWLAYEHTEEGDLEIYMQLIDGSIDPVRLSSNSGADYSPAWRPGAQQIAFVSDRGGSAQIWLVDLEAEGDARFQLLIDSDDAQNSPAWSPDGDWLAWSQRTDGDWTIFAQDVGEVDSAPRRIGLGEDPRLSLNGSVLLAKLRGVNENYLTAYTLSGGIALAPEALPGSLDGIAWGAGALPEQLPEPLASAALVTPNAIDFTAASNSVVDLSDVNAPFEQLSNAAAPAFDALRSRGAQLLGWDALSELSNAFVPLDQPLSPDRQRDWLYTGRAFELHSGLLNAGWMAIVREDFEGQTYWRIYLKAVADLGRPLTDLPWDLGARFSGTESN
jgi:TolB protein